ncbi:hypothetical protein [Rhodoferax sp.]|uniref:hypothetical protein n=1 Tax=Rhodoferax sp. TaxID=50421 RepID=UPI00273498F2|nr:hypothetical protein [Rhodoferax sp.]MDP3191043.1 hypothetical protein [Rhodoferax sp.]MDP3864371.1 hypothetical protein [Rhodoferax sp.]
MDIFSFLRKHGSPPSPTDEVLYEFVAAELANSMVKQGLWTKALSDAEWNEAKAKGLYVKMRIVQLRSDLLAQVAQQQTLFSGLSEEEIEYLGKPIKAIRHIEKYHLTKDTVDTTALGDFIFAPLKAATHDRSGTGDTQDKLLDALKLKLTSTQIGTITTALAGNETTNSIRQLVLTSLIGLKNISFDHFAKINSKKNADFATENVKNTYTYATSVGVRVSGNGVLIAANAASFKKLLIIFY